MAFRLTFRKEDGTLNDSEVEKEIQSILTGLKQEKRIVIRS